MNFKGKKVLIMGLGLHGGGLEVARFFAKHQAKVKVTDLKPKKELLPSIKKLAGFKIEYSLGGHKVEDFKEADLIIRNPDVPLDSFYLDVARKKGIPIEMDVSLFLKLCPKRENVIGVTGTRGKTTTTFLIGEILKNAGFHTLLGGNLPGIATLSLLDKITKKSKIVLELSSWQLQSLGWSSLSPHIAVVTNIYPDHLNRYKNMDEYIKDKKIIFKYQKRGDFLVLNKRNKIVESFAKEAKSKVVWFSLNNKISHLANNNFQLRGKHNLENLAAAFKVAKILKIDDKIILRAIKKFKGVPFRLEEIAKINGVIFVNDTTSTMPQATIAALEAYKNREIILICGGASKNLDYQELGQEINKRVKKVVLLEGTATSDLAKAINNNNIILGRFINLKEALLSAKRVAKKGDIILFSPACASFGMFKNEFIRGKEFNEIVYSLKN